MRSSKVVVFAETVRNGHREISQAGELWLTYGFVVFGNLLSWIWQVMDVIVSGGEFSCGPPLVIGAKLILSLIAGFIVMATLWPKLKDVSKPYRLFLAIAAGFFTEAFFGPPVGLLAAVAG